MRILLALVVIVVFAALMILDTAALIRLTAACVTGGCGFSPLWIAAVAGGIVIAALVSSRRPPAKAKRAAKTRAPKAKTGTAARTKGTEMSARKPRATARPKSPGNTKSPKADRNAQRVGAAAACELFWAADRGDNPDFWRRWHAFCS
jgi:hypothetical protein